ncbi:MAG TPA: hypothetical protein V6C91_00575, partial [Coleofasciculaceae cyanobacterium]
MGAIACPLLLTFMTMTRFDPNKNQKTPSEWSALALNTTRENNLQWNVIGGIVLGAVAASAASPLTGGLVATYFLWDSWRKASGIQRNQAAIVESGCVAQVLDGDDFINYASQVGRDAVLAELRYASARNLPMSNAAYDYLEDNAATPALMPAREPQEANVFSSIPQALPASVGAFSKSPLVDIYQPDRPQDFDLCDRMGKDATSHLIVGVPGAGKGLTISNALAALRKHHPKITIFYVDPKNDEKETGYFTDRVDVLRRASVREMTPSAAVEWFKDSIRKFEEIQGDKLLIFDESTIVSSKFKLAKELDWIKDKLIGYASCGDSIGLRIWIVAQNAHTDDLGINGGVRSQFVPIAIICRKNLAALGALFSTKFIPQNQKLDTDEVEIICNQSPVNRAVYHGGENKWFPAKRLPNPSGYDRDSRHFLDKSPAQKVAELSEAASTIFEVVKSATKYPVSFEAIRKSRKWDNSPDKQAILDGVSELISNEKI